MMLWYMSRMARMVRSPVVGMISTLMWSFNSASQAYLQVRIKFTPETELVIPQSLNVCGGTLI